MASGSPTPVSVMVIGMQFSTTTELAIAVLILLNLACEPALAEGPPVVVDQVEVNELWRYGAHNAFTDLIGWQDRFYCAFREGYQHVSNDGKIRVLVSEDGESWQPTALIALSGYDLRDAALAITPDNRLMLLGGAAPRLEHDPGLPRVPLLPSLKMDGTGPIPTSQ